MGGRVTVVTVEEMLVALVAAMAATDCSMNTRQGKEIVVSADILAAMEMVIEADMARWDALNRIRRHPKSIPRLEILS